MGGTLEKKQLKEPITIFKNRVWDSYKNILIVGVAGSGKVRNLYKPDVMKHTSVSFAQEELNE